VCLSICFAPQAALFRVMSGTNAVDSRETGIPRNGKPTIESHLFSFEKRPAAMKSLVKSKKEENSGTGLVNKFI
jgi:hypothetical protein